MEDPLRKCKLHNKFGAFCYQGGRIPNAMNQYTKALELLPPDITYTNLYFNIANIYAEQKNPQKAIEFYLKVVDNSPYRLSPIPDNIDTELHAKGAYCESFNNLSVQYMTLNRLPEAREACLKALELNPDATEANVNLGNCLRQMGLRSEAVAHVWNRVALDCARDGVEFDLPVPIDCVEAEVAEIDTSGPLHVVCVKWGKKYGPEYVNKLFHGVNKFLIGTNFDFTCFTEDAEGLEEGILVRPFAEDWTGWWGKATLFSDLGVSGRFLYIDLDTVICGDLSDLAGYRGKFLLMGTSDIYCETAKDGFNSSIIAWPDNFGRHIYTRLKRYYKYVLKYICRFDHWLEMNICNADLVQTLYPSQFLDYTTYCKDVIPAGCRMVCFPREPKPHYCEAPWIHELWV